METLQLLGFELRAAESFFVNFLFFKSTGIFLCLEDKKKKEIDAEEEEGKTKMKSRMKMKKKKMTKTHSAQIIFLSYPFTYKDPYLAILS